MSDLGVMDGFWFGLGRLLSGLIVPAVAVLAFGIVVAVVLLKDRIQRRRKKRCP